MKKRVLLLSTLVALTGVTQAQTWSFSDEATIGDAIQMFVVDSNAVNYSASTGSAQTWDYSQLGGYTSNDKVIDVLDASASQYASSFPSSALNMIIPEYMEMFYTTNASEKQGQGFVLNIDGVGEAIIEFNTNNQHLMNYPMSLGSSLNDAFEGTLEIMGNPSPASGETWVEADGTGTLLLANSTSHTDVIRVKTIDTIYTSITVGVPMPVTIAREQYDYYKSGTSTFPLFSHSRFDVISAVYNVSFGVVLSSVNPSATVGIQDTKISETTFNIFPNPSNGNFTVSLPSTEDARIQIIDAVGNIVKTILPVSTETVVSLATEANGVYFVKASANGDSKTMKLIVRN